MNYSIILADVPWSFKVWSKATGNGRSAESHYRTMSLEDIKNLDVPSLADDNCALFLWVTMPTLPEGLEVMKVWGFTYKTCAFTWVKRNKIAPSWFWGMGYWTRANAELCLLGTKGKPKRVSKSVHQIIDTPIERHSQKPAIVRDKIVELMGDLPRLEMFARTKPQGWDVFGNEVEDSIEIESRNKNREEKPVDRV